MKFRLTCAALISILAGTGPSTAGSDSADLVELCEKYVALPKTGEVTPEFIQLKSSCAGYINSHVKMSKPEDGFCVPKGYNMDDFATIFMDWVKKNPDRVKEPTKITMTAALSEKYPCAK
jgi:Rap1a immunity proteins